MPRSLAAALTLIGALACLTGACPLVRQARASQLPPVAGVGYPNVPIDRGKKVSTFFGYSYGNDSNITYAASGSEVTDDFQEALVGLIYVTGVPSRSFDIRYEGKYEFFQKESDTDYADHVVKTSLVLQTEKTSLMVRATAESLARSTEIEATGLLSRERYVGGGDLGFRMGQTELTGTATLGYNLYPEDDALDYLNLGLGGEFRLWRGETRHYFLHFDVGGVQYARDEKDDFGYRRLYLGLRSERTARSGYEIAGGVQGNASSLDMTSPAQEEIFWSVRSTWLVLNQRGALVAGFTQGGEASLLVDTAFKTVQRMTLRFSYAANARLSLTLGGMSEAAVFGVHDPTIDPPPPDDMSRLQWDLGIMYEIGSPQRLHGRLFASYGTEGRKGNAVVSDYGRTRWFGGVALVY